jgi:hypothetical protein
VDDSHHPGHHRARDLHRHPGPGTRGLSPAEPPSRLPVVLCDARCGPRDQQRSPDEACQSGWVSATPGLLKIRTRWGYRRAAMRR